jgi:hypothetical protein
MIDVAFWTTRFGIRAGIGEHSVQIHNPRYDFSRDARWRSRRRNECSRAATDRLRIATAELTSY